MKERWKKLSYLMLIFSVYFIAVPSTSFAQSTPSSSTRINARILPTIWYSSLSIKEGDKIKIYSGLQNNSGVDISGTVSFYIDNNKVASDTFVSKSESLKDVSINWVAEPGTHEVQVKIVPSLPADKILISTETDVSKISVERIITQEVIQESIMNTATLVVDKVDQAANALADKVISLKSPTMNTSVTNPSKLTGSVLGASTSTKASVKNSEVQSNSPFNIVWDLLATLLRHWKWTLSGLVVLFLVVKLINNK
ncbi:MAG: hypothetical protein WAV25_02550 [Minisyncoccia bacterium]